MKKLIIIIVVCNSFFSVLSQDFKLEIGDTSFSFLRISNLQHPILIIDSDHSYSRKVGKHINESSTYFEDPDNGVLTLKTTYVKSKELSYDYLVSSVTKKEFTNPSRHQFSISIDGNEIDIIGYEASVVTDKVINFYSEDPISISNVLFDLKNEKFYFLIKKIKFIFEGKYYEVHSKFLWLIEN